MPKVKSTRDFESLEILDGKVKVHQRETLKHKDTFYIDELNWTEKQKKFIDISLKKNTRVILCKGPAGSSKTLIAVYSALNLLNLSKVSDIIYMRSAVESSDSRLGFLPGDADEKLHYYNLPFKFFFFEIPRIPRFRKCIGHVMVQIRKRGIGGMF